MPRITSDALWEEIPIGFDDEEGEIIWDYVLAGSEEPSPWEAMVLAAAAQQEISA